MVENEVEVDGGLMATSRSFSAPGAHWRAGAQGSLGHPTTVSSVAPSAHSRTMLTDPGGTRKPAQREGGASIARPTAARTCTA